MSLYCMYLNMSGIGELDDIPKPVKDDNIVISKISPLNIT